MKTLVLMLGPLLSPVAVEALCIPKAAPAGQPQ
jgi:hypothetical protein